MMDPDELVALLRQLAESEQLTLRRALLEAADEIERRREENRRLTVWANQSIDSLQAENERLRAA